MAFAETTRGAPAGSLFTNIFNFRDLGGLATVDGDSTRHGRLFRADGLHRADATDRRLLWMVGVRRVIDLRTPAERVEDGTFQPVEDDTEYWHVPVVDDLWGWQNDEDDLLTRYQAMVGRAGRRVAGVAERIVMDSRPAVFHCTAGKDRTGVVAALLLSSIGVTDDAIADDYARSADAMRYLVDWYRTNRTPDELDLTPAMTARALGLAAADRETVLDLLTWVRDQHGSAKAYVLAAGAEPETIARLRRHMLS